MKTKKCGPECIACDCGRTDNKCKFNIWMDGFSVNGNRQEPQLIIEDVIGEDFESACFIALSGRGDYNITANSIYGCKLYKTKEECKFKGGEK